MNPILEYFWIAGIVFPVINYFMSRSKLKEITDSKPELQEGYDKISKGIMILMISPWVIVGIGNLSGYTHNVFEYFNPRSYNPFVLTFHTYIILAYVWTIWWVYFNDGAAFMAKHPGFIKFQGFGSSKDLTSPLSIKIFFAFCLLGGIAALVMMWSVDMSHFTKIGVKIH